MTFAYGKKSQDTLAGVSPVLQDIFRAAIGLSHVDYGIFEGLRTAERQQEYLRRGVTKTKNSKHLKQADGFSHAVDAVPWIDGGFRWEWEPIYQIACAVDIAATRLGLASKLRWGGVWDRTLADYGSGTNVSMKQAVSDYCKRHPGPDFIDGPHYELVS